MSDPSDIRVGVLRIEGTNCEDESALAFSSLGCNTEKVHLKQLIGEVERSECRDIMDYDALYFPGGFSSGDYVRAGAIFASRVKSGLKSSIFVRFDIFKIVKTKTNKKKMGITVNKEILLKIKKK